MCVLGNGSNAYDAGSLGILSGFEVLGAGEGTYGANVLQGLKGAGGKRGHRVALRGQGVMQPAFSPSGNTLVDCDGALIKLKQWQDYSVHSETVNHVRRRRIHVRRRLHVRRRKQWQDYSVHSETVKDVVMFSKTKSVPEPNLYMN